MKYRLELQKETKVQPEGALTVYNKFNWRFERQSETCQLKSEKPEKCSLRIGTYIYYLARSDANTSASIAEEGKC